MKSLWPVLSLFDAVNVALGAIIGAGIFVIIGTAAGAAGPAVFISVLIAAAVAVMTGLASAELSRIYPKSGGAYLFAKEALSDWAGFVVGWVWIFSNVVAGAAVAVGFGHYAAFFVPSIPVQAWAAVAISAAAALNLAGMRNESKVNNVLVAVKVAILLFFIAVALFYFKPANFEPLAPFGLGGVLAGAATIFFAYSGFSRVAVIADEVKDAKRNVPAATLISIAVSTLLYAAVAVAAVGVAGYAALAESESPLADAMAAEGAWYGGMVMAFGALLATGTVLLGSILGVSRLAYKMACDRELPSFLCAMSSSGVPVYSIALGSAAIFALAFAADLSQIVYISSFSHLLYYAAINLSGLRVFRSSVRYAAAGGLVSCIVLMASLPQLSWMIGFGTVLAGAAYYALFVRRSH